MFQDEINNKNTISPEATEVAHAYDKAEHDKQNIARLTLGLDLKKESKITKLPKKKETPDYLTLNAANVIEGATEEDKQHDEDIMDDPNF